MAQARLSASPSGTPRCGHARRLSGSRPSRDADANDSADADTHADSADANDSAGSNTDHARHRADRAGHTLNPNGEEQEVSPSRQEGRDPGGTARDPIDVSRTYHSRAHHAGDGPVADDQRRPEWETPGERAAKKHGIELHGE